MSLAVSGQKTVFLAFFGTQMGDPDKIYGKKWGNPDFIQAKILDFGFSRPDFEGPRIPIWVPHLLSGVLLLYDVLFIASRILVIHRELSAHYTQKDEITEI